MRFIMLLLDFMGLKLRVYSTSASVESGGRLGYFNFVHLNLFQISDFEFRILVNYPPR